MLNIMIVCMSSSVMHVCYLFLLDSENHKDKDLPFFFSPFAIFFPFGWSSTPTSSAKAGTLSTQ